MFQRAGGGTDGTRVVVTLDPLRAPPPGPVGRSFPWAIHKGLPLYIHTDYSVKLRALVLLAPALSLHFLQFRGPHISFHVCGNVWGKLEKTSSACYALDGP